MVVNKRNIINTAILAALIISPMSMAENDNSLVQLDLRRSSDSSVDVTLVTSDNYGDNVMVRKKSDTKYVILVPKIKSSGYRASSLAGVNDLVSNIDVKTVDDTSGGYTKVTLITKRPLDIKTRTQKSAMSNSEQSEYNSLISQANAVKNNISRREPPKATEQKTEVTVNKTPAVKTADSKAQNTTAQSKPKIELKEIKPEAIEKKVSKPEKNNLISNVKKDKVLDKLPQALPEVSVPDTPSENTVLSDAPEEMLEPVETVSKNSQFKASFKAFFSGLAAKSKSLAHGLPKALGVGLVVILTLSALAKLFAKSAHYVMEEPLQAEFDKISKGGSVMDKQVNDDYVTRKDLSWRDKYRLYLDKSAEPVKRANKKGHYSFIKTPAKAEIEKKRQELERLVVPPTVSEIKQPDTEKVHSEESVIAKNIKLKAFKENTPSLKMTSRKGSRFKGFATKLPLHEQPTINLDDSPLSSNPRNLADANLKVSDVDRRRITYEPKEYIMSSVDEYLSILDQENEVKVMKENVYSQLPDTASKAEHMTPPLKAEKPEGAKNIIVKSSYKIAPKKGLYVIDKNGRNALVGKVNDKTFVLKKFNSTVTAPIQVRQDNENVYMVKAGKFKSLVEVNDDNMGVLIEL